MSHCKVGSRQHWLNGRMSEETTLMPVSSNEGLHHHGSKPDHMDGPLIELLSSWFDLTSSFHLGPTEAENFHLLIILLLKGTCCLSAPC